MKTGYEQMFLDNEKIELSSAASLSGPLLTGNANKRGTHIAWLTGGIFIPEKEYNIMYEIGKSLTQT